jgi:hypothetical protein
MRLRSERSSRKSKNSLGPSKAPLPPRVTHERLISFNFFNLQGIPKGELIHSKIKNTQSEEILSSKIFFGTPATILDSFGGFACEGGD